MFMFTWFWAATAALACPPAPPQPSVETTPSPIVQTVDREILTLGWVDDDDAPIF